MTHFGHVQCWEHERVSLVVNTQALNISRDLFLATHTPFNFLEFRNARRAIPQRTEAALLADLQESAAQDEHVFVAVQGVPGAGKSNLIRWLYLQYLAERSPTEQVLLIERENNSLRNTLLRVMRIFGDDQFARERELLQRANSQLSGRALNEAILNSFHVLAVSVQEGQPFAGALPPQVIVNNTPGFLLDQTIRAHLVAARVEHIAAQLNGLAERPDEMPEFSADDFLLSAQQRRRIRQAANGDDSDNAQYLADELNDDADLRVAMAAYFNRMMSEAISGALQLSPGDLKRMFGELRKHMAANGQTLVLFIEDITAFSGLDAGLVDVLATEHRGDTGLCRLTSVIGITDSYYGERFPDNMRDRLTLRVILPVPERNEPFLLDLAARHLNAMRVQPDDLRGWAEQANASPLPIACSRCPARERCHPAFGTVSFINRIEDTAAQQSVGLFPFNARALLTMYSGLDEQQRTPRHFLNFVVGHVMISHGQEIPAGHFPPKSDTVGSEFKPPPFAKPGQRNLLNTNALSPDQRQRLESLVVFWGDGTLDDCMEEGVRTLSRLPLGVFEAFQLPMIAGESVGDGVSSFAVPAHEGTGHTATVHAPSMANAALPVIPSIAPNVTPASAYPTAAARRGNYHEELEGWFTSGEKLIHSDELAKAIAAWITVAIDWEFAGVTPTQVQDRVVQRFFPIEGQASTTNPPNAFRLNRNQETLNLLNAVDQLSGADLDLPTEVIGLHVATLSGWLQRNEGALADYVRRPSENLPAPMPLIRALGLVQVWAAWVNGALTEEADTPEALYDILVSQRTRSWNIQPGRTERWQRLATGLEPDMRREARAETAYSEFFALLNRAQGDAREVKFLDAAWALETLAALQAQSFQLPPDLFAREKITGLWEKVAGVYHKLLESASTAARQEWNTAQETLDDLKTLLGDDKPRAVWEAIAQTVALVEAGKYRFDFEVKDGLRPGRLNQLVQQLDTALGSEGLRAWLWLSGALDILTQAHEFRDYLHRYSAAAQALSATLPGGQGATTSESDAPINHPFEHDFEHWIRLLDGLGETR